MEIRIAVPSIIRSAEIALSTRNFHERGELTRIGAPLRGMPIGREIEIISLRGRKIDEFRSIIAVSPYYFRAVRIFRELDLVALALSRKSQGNRDRPFSFSFSFSSPPPPVPRPPLFRRCGNKRAEKAACTFPSNNAARAVTSARDMRGVVSCLGTLMKPFNSRRVRKARRGR
jgi:hypothetical protein